MEACEEARFTRDGARTFGGIHFNIIDINRPMLLLNDPSMTVSLRQIPLHRYDPWDSKLVIYLSFDCYKSS